MSKSNRRSARHRRVGLPCRAGAVGGRAQRLLSAEKLEDRTLLAADIFGWHNAAAPTDVNADGYTSVVDALLVINDLNAYGVRGLSSLQATAPVSAGEGEPASGANAYLDVNGDNFISPIDALIVINLLNAEAEGDELVRFRTAITNTSGSPITSVLSGQQFELTVYVQDIRTSTNPANMGVAAAYPDLAFSDSDLFSIPGVNPANFRASFDFTVGPYTTTPHAVDGDFAVPPAVTTVTQGGGGNNEIQRVSLNNDLAPVGSPATFTLTFQGSPTGQISFNATAADVQSALEGLASVNPGDVSVTGEAGGPWTVEFTGAKANTNFRADDHCRREHPGQRGRLRRSRRFHAVGPDESAERTASLVGDVVGRGQRLADRRAERGGRSVVSGVGVRRHDQRPDHAGRRSRGPVVPCRSRRRPSW